MVTIEFHNVFVAAYDEQVRFETTFCFHPPLDFIHQHLADAALAVRGIHCEVIDQTAPPIVPADDCADDPSTPPRITVIFRDEKQIGIAL